MALPNKFLYFKTLQRYNDTIKELSAIDKLRFEDSISFIEDVKTIKTKNINYNGRNVWAVEDLLNDSNIATQCLNISNVGDILTFYNAIMLQIIYSLKELETSEHTIQAWVSSQESGVAVGQLLELKFDNTVKKYIVENENIIRFDKTWSQQLILTDTAEAQSFRRNVKIGDGILLFESSYIGSVSSIVIDPSTGEAALVFFHMLYSVPFDLTLEWDDATKLYKTQEDKIESVTTATLKDYTLEIPLTGLLLSSTSIAASDSILTAFGKLQGQMNNKIGSTGSISGNAATATKLQTPRSITISGAISGTALFDGSNNISINSSLAGIDASKITSGTIDIERLPKGALERLVKVANQSARFALTTSDVQDGDTVQQMDTGIMYFVVDITKLNSEAGYNIYTAGTATSVPWSGVTGKPTFSSVATSGSYNDLSNKPVIPTNTNQLTNGSGYITSAALNGYATQTWVGQQGYITSIPAQTWASITGKPSFATVATSGSYNDLSNTPSIPSLAGYATESWVNSKGYLTSIPVASISTSGIVTTAEQTFAGEKTFFSGLKTANINEEVEDEGLTIGYNTYGLIRIGTDGDFNFGPGGGAYTGSAAMVKNSLTFTGATTGTYNGSASLTVDIPEIPIALPNPYNLTINGFTYNGSRSLAINTILSYGTLLSSTVKAGFNYNNTASRTITTFSGFSANNPDSVIISTAKLTFTAPNIIKMDGLDDLSGTYYIYCLSYMANGKIAINGAVYN